MLISVAEWAVSVEEEGSEAQKGLLNTTWVKKLLELLDESNDEDEDEEDDEGDD